MGVRFAAAVLAAVCFLFPATGCMTGERYGRKPLDLKVPERWDSLPDGSRSRGEGLSTVDGWLGDFNDEGLILAVHTALKANPGMLEAVRKVSLARQALALSKSRMLPEVSGSLQLDVAESLAGGDGVTLKATEKTGTGLLGVSWEPDLWGRLSALEQADRAEFESAVLDCRSVRLSLAAQTAKAWFNAVAAGGRARLSGAVHASFHQEDLVVTRRFVTGLASAMDVRLMRSEAAAARVAMMEQEQERKRAIRVLNVLIGRYPSSRMAALPDRLPHVAGGIPCGLPAGLLARRPDIAAAQKRILSRDFMTLAAEKSLLPSLSLTGTGGVSSLDLRHLAGADDPVWRLGSSLTLPLFRGGALRAEIRRSALAAEAAWIDYERIVLTAFQEAEDAIDAEQALRKREQTLIRLLAEARGALGKAWDLYLAGETEITSVLSAKRTVIQAQKSMIAVSLARLTNRVDLYLVLGGAFETGKATFQNGKG